MMNCVRPFALLKTSIEGMHGSGGTPLLPSGRCTRATGRSCKRPALSASRAWLNKAYDERSGWLLELKTDPVWDNIRAEPRVDDLRKRVAFVN
jgi:hypothetical protein